MKRSNIFTYGFVTAVIIAVLLIIVVSLGKEVKRQQNVTNGLQSIISSYVIEVDTLRESVYETQAVVVEKESQLQLAEQEILRLAQLNIRNVNMIASLELKVTALRDSLLLMDNTDTVHVIEYITEEDTLNVVEIPLEFGWETHNIVSWGGIDETGLGYSGFVVDPLPLNIVLGSRGFFQKQYVSSVSTSVPEVKVTHQHTQIVIPKRKAWPYAVCVSVGVVAGVVLTAL